jgi:hypothetical protein
MLVTYLQHPLAHSCLLTIFFWWFDQYCVKSTNICNGWHKPLDNLDPSWWQNQNNIVCHGIFLRMKDTFLTTSIKQIKLIFRNNFKDIHATFWHVNDWFDWMKMSFFRRIHSILFLSLLVMLVKTIFRAGRLTSTPQIIWRLTYV